MILSERTAGGIHYYLLKGYDKDFLASLPEHGEFPDVYDEFAVVCLMNMDDVHKMHEHNISKINVYVLNMFCAQSTDGTSWNYFSVTDSGLIEYFNKMVDSLQKMPEWYPIAGPDVGKITRI